VTVFKFDMSTSDVARSERVLAKVGAALGITPQGAEWLKAAIDPFHDTPLNVCGYPDIMRRLRSCKLSGFLPLFRSLPQ